MRNVIDQLYINKFKVRREIEGLQSIKDFDSPQSERVHRAVIDAKHEEWDRIEHMINLFFNSLGVK